ncbi:MAG: pyocin activator PrtN family protein [Pseudomonadota bacterium]
MAEFDGAACVELEKVSEKYFGLSPEEAKRRAARDPARLPVPPFRGGSQKAPWLISLADLAAHLDSQREAARRAWEQDRAARMGHRAPAPA